MPVQARLCPNGWFGSFLAFGHTTPVIIVDCTIPAGRSQSQSVDQSQNLPEQSARHGDLRYLKGDVARVADDLRADFDQLLAQASQ